MYRPVDASMLERAGYGLTQRRIRLLEGKFDKTQEEQDELAILQTICARYRGDLVSFNSRNF